MPKIHRNPCAHFELPFSKEFAYPPKHPACGMQANTSGQHGWLCTLHKGENDESTRVYRGHKPVTEPEFIAGIIASEKRAIATGTKQRIRFGSVEPIYLTVLT